MSSSSDPGGRDSRSLLDHFPYEHPREIQAECLRALEENWDRYDVFVMSAPTAFGKSALARTLMNAHYSVSLLTPTNQLVQQFIAEFPETRTLSRIDSYHCRDWDRSCAVTRAKLGGFCRGCQCGSDLAQAKYRNGPGVYNYHTYLAHKLYRRVLVCDEAHNLIPIIRERQALRYWQHNLHYPGDMRTESDLRDWMENTIPEARVRRSKSLSLLYESVTSPRPEYVMHRTSDWFNGKGTVRGEPELRDCIDLEPVDISNAPPLFWPREVEKVVLLSATIGPQDIQTLGISKHRRVIYIDCTSPIPAENRPVIPLNCISISRSNQAAAVEVVAREIEAIAQHHAGEKGVIHATYGMATQLAETPLRNNPRLLFHDRTNKQKQYQFFRDSPPGEGRILVACGMYEGIDLPEDLGRWQVIAKVPWLSLGNPAVRHLAEDNPEGYLWDCIRTVIQACGRICRTPEDWGVTYILDSTFNRLVTEGGHMLPTWFTEALILPPRGDSGE